MLFSQVLYGQDTIRQKKRTDQELQNQKEELQQLQSTEPAKEVILEENDSQKTEDQSFEEFSEMSFESLMSIKISTASKFEEESIETPSTMMVITAQDIEEGGYTNIVEVIADLPGFDTIVSNGYQYASFFIRGNSTEMVERTLLFINGVNYQSVGFQDMNISRAFPLSAIKRIEVLYGPSSAIYGADAFGGIVNIITKNPNDLAGDSSSFSMDLTGGSYNTGYGDFAYVGKTANNLGILLSAGYFRSDEPDYANRPGFFSDEIIRNSWKPMSNRYYEYKDPSNDYFIISRLTFRSLELGYNRLSIAEGSGPEYPLDKTLAETQWKTFRNLVFLKYSRDFSGKLNMSTVVSFKNGDTPPDAAWAERYDVEADDPEVPGHGTDDVSMGYWQFYNAQYKLSHDFIYRNTIRIGSFPIKNSRVIVSGGANYSINDLQKGYVINWGDWIEDTEETYTGYPEVPEDNVGEHHRYKMYCAGAYLQLKWVSPGSKLVFAPGIRYDYNSIYENTTNPRIGLSYQFVKNWILKLNYANGFQYPSPRHLYGGWEGTQVNEDLKPEKISAYEAGIQSSFLKGLWNELSFFFNRIEQSNMQGTNLPEKQIFGLEYKLKYRINPLKNRIEDLNFFFYYSYVHPKFKEPIISESTGRTSDKIGSIASNKFNIGMGCEFFKYFYFHFRGNYVGKRPTVVTNPIDTIDHYFVAHAGLQIRNLTSEMNLSVSALVNNIFDTEYYHPGLVDAGAGEDTSQNSLSWYSSRLPQPKRNFMFSLRGEY